MLKNEESLKKFMQNLKSSLKNPVFLAVLMVISINSFGVEYTSSQSSYAQQNRLDSSYYEQTHSMVIDEAESINLPLYSWSLISSNRHKLDLRKYVKTHNSKFKDMPLLSSNDILKSFAPSFGSYLFLLQYLERQQEDFRVEHTCSLDITGEMEFFLSIYDHKAKPIVVDIGSGLGVCAKQLALAGYEVFSIDKSKNSIEHQQKNFCIIPDEGTFIHQYWKKHHPKMLNSEVFKEHCKSTINNNIHFIHGDFIDQKTLSQIPKGKKWDIVIAQNSFQYFDADSRAIAFNTVDTHLRKYGFFIISSQPKITYEHQNIYEPIYDLDLREELDQGYLREYYVYRVTELNYHNKLAYINSLTLYKIYNNNQNKELHVR